MAFFFSSKMLVFYTYILSVFYIHRRGLEKHSFSRQLTDHSTFLAPFNAFIYIFSAVPDLPFLDNKLFPETKLLEMNWEAIRDEGLALLTQGMVKASNKYDDAGFNSFFKKGWTRFYIKWYGYAYPSAIKYCPHTVSLLNQIPSIKAAMFAYLPPGARLVRHRDPYAGSLRYHLGLNTPNSMLCKMVVDNQERYWQDGQSLFFDETYIHYADNQTEQGRLILLCDIERPMRFILPKYINRLMTFFILKMAVAPNEYGENIGIVNRIFKIIYPIRILGKKIKKINKTLYYVLKYSLFLLLIYLIPKIPDMF
jgi:beta-hydroxylase